MKPSLAQLPGSASGDRRGFAPRGYVVQAHLPAPLHDHALLPWRFFPALVAADAVLAVR